MDARERRGGRQAASHLCMPTNPAFRHVFRQLERCGLLLESDREFPSVVTLVAGGPVRGSWWAHPMAQEIYAVSHPLAEHADVVVCKLVSGKNTFVHRSFWPALLAVGRAREPWQLRDLPSAARKLLAAVSRSGGLRTDAIPWPGGRRKDSPGELARELERRLLVYSEEVHTETGAHAKQLETWQRWAKRVGLRTRMSAATGQRRLGDAVVELNDRSRATGRLPWQRHP